MAAPFQVLFSETFWLLFSFSNQNALCYYDWLTTNKKMAEIQRRIDVTQTTCWIYENMSEMLRSKISEVINLIIKFYFLHVIFYSKSLSLISGVAEGSGAMVPLKFPKCGIKVYHFWTNNQKIFRRRGLHPHTPILSWKLYLDDTTRVIFACELFFPQCITWQRA